MLLSRGAMRLGSTGAKSCRRGQDASGKRRQLHMFAATTQLLCFERFSCRYSFVICFPLAIDAGKHEDTARKQEKHFYPELVGLVGFGVNAFWMDLAV